jgi:NAD-dependent dihydropyrimidine dehydrogenase PreA subunit
MYVRKMLLEKLIFFIHKHSHINIPENCIGCYNCIRVCKNESVIKIENEEL